MNKLEHIWLSKIEISCETKKYLINRLEGIENLYSASLDDLVYLNCSDKIIKKIMNLEIKEKAKYDYEYCLNNNIEIIDFDDEEYPNALKLIDEMPISLYCIGNLELLNKESVSIIGSRYPLRQASAISRTLGRIFSNAKINVVSGLARGIDKYAHLGALDTNNKLTIGVLGSGIDIDSFYPYENKHVRDRIINEGGLIISEYPIGSAPLRYHFPYRNRIISGLASKIFVIQASKNSGSLITVDYALNQGKDVYVYNYESANISAFDGNKQLIEDGAISFGK